MTVLIKKGKRIVRAQQEFARAVLLEADGTPSTNRRVKRARGITRWRFVFDNQTPNNQYASVLEGPRASYVPPGIAVASEM